MIEWLIEEWMIKECFVSTVKVVLITIICNYEERNHWLTLHHHYFWMPMMYNVLLVSRCFAEIIV